MRPRKQSWSRAVFAAGLFAATALTPSLALAADKSKFWWFIESSGFIGLIILILSIYFV